MLLGQETTSNLELGQILMGLAGGLALSLFGMDHMSNALKLVAGTGMKKVLGKLTTNRFTGAISGAIVTAFLQSSSITTVLVVGFISAGLMNLAQSAGVIMGANIGTTITAQVIAFKVTEFALVPIAIGFAISFVIRNEKIRNYGHVVMGIGLVFFGMKLMSEGTYPLRDYQPFIDWMRQMDNPVWGILLAAAFTGLVQSSSATTGIVIVLASQGFITLEAGIALIFGANIGTCITAALAAIGRKREAIRAALIHILFNLLGVAIWLGFIDQLATLVTLISPRYVELSGAERLAAETPRQIANAHTIFNVANTLIFIWLIGPMVWLVRKTIPDRIEKQSEAGQPRYISNILIRTPSVALDTVRLELGRLGAAAIHMVRAAIDSVIHGSDQQLHKLEQMDNDVDALHGAIVTYLGQLAQENLSEKQAAQLNEYLAASNYIENIGDMIESSLVEIGRGRLSNQVTVSEETEKLLRSLHTEVARCIQQSIRALVKNDVETANIVLQAKAEINLHVKRAELQVARRLSAEEPNRLAAFRFESEMIEYFKRMYYFAKRIAKIVEAGANSDSRETSASKEAK